MLFSVSSNRAFLFASSGTERSSRTATWQYNRNEGLLLKFNGDVVYLVLIRGSNLDRSLDDGSANLTRAGLQGHRVVWLREMTPEEIRQTGDPKELLVVLRQFVQTVAARGCANGRSPGMPLYLSRIERY